MPSLLEQKPDLGGYEEYLGYDIPFSGPMPLVTKMDIIRQLPREIRSYLSPVLRKMRSDFLKNLKEFKYVPEQSQSPLTASDAAGIYGFYPTAPKENLIQIYGRTHSGYTPHPAESATATIHELSHLGHHTVEGTQKYIDARQWRVNEYVADLIADKLGTYEPLYLKWRMVDALSNPEATSLLGPITKHMLR